MELELAYETKENIPAAYAELYTERDGKWHLSGVKGLKTQADVDAVHTGLVKERGEHKTTKSSLANWRKLTNPETQQPFEKPEDVQTLLDSLPELKTAAEAGGSKSAEAVARQVEAAKKTLETTMGRELTTLKDSNAKLTAKVEAFESNLRITALRKAAMDAATDTNSKLGRFNPDALEDMLLYAERHLEVDEERDEETGDLIIKGVHTRDGVGVTPALGAAAWLAEMQPKKGHWYMPSEGTGPRGSGSGFNGAGNPWGGDSWNVTEQGRYVRQHGMEKANQMAKAAGTTVGGPRPAPTGNRSSGPVTQPRRSAGGLRGGR